MKPLFLIFVLNLFVSSCKTENTVAPKNFTKVEVEVLMQDSLLNIRALEIDAKQRKGIFATSRGEIGSFSTDDNVVKIEHQLKYDTIVPNFRSVEITSKGVFALSIISPTLLYKVDTDSTQVVYKENHPKAFYDSMRFWNDQEGIAVGDTTDDCLSIITTRDGGKTWYKTPCKDLPKGEKNEGAFAASDTNIAIVDNNTWVATNTGRVYYSGDKGKTWQVFSTPIVKEKETEGIYSIDFYDAQHGFAIGGDYTKPENNDANKIRTLDGGKTWQLVAQGQEPGYRSCVQYIPNSQAKQLVAVGFKGIDYSNDSGNTWKHLSNESFYTIRFLNDSVAYAAGKEQVSKLVFKK